MQVEHDELEAKIKEGEDQLVAKREEYLKFNKAGFQIDAWKFQVETRIMIGFTLEGCYLDCIIFLTFQNGTCLRAPSCKHRFKNQ